MTESEQNAWSATLKKHNAPDWLINQSLARMAAGEVKYGPYDLSKIETERDFPTEIEEELLDAINYSLMDGGKTLPPHLNILGELVKLTIKIREHSCDDTAGSTGPSENQQQH